MTIRRRDAQRLDGPTIRHQVVTVRDLMQRQDIELCANAQVLKRLFGYAPRREHIRLEARMNCGVRPLIALTLAGALLLGGSGCGSDDDDDAEVAAAATPIAQVQNLTGVASEVILAQEFREDLQGLNIMPKPTGKATRTGNTLSFPITGGSATYYPPGTEDPHFQGSILHENSGLQLTKGATTVELTKLIFDGSEMRMFGNIVVNGRTVSEVAPLFTLNGQTFEPLQITDAGTAVLEGATVNLTPNAVRLLNKTFDISALSKDTAVGTAEIVLQLSPS